MNDVQISRRGVLSIAEDGVILSLLLVLFGVDTLNPINIPFMGDEIVLGGSAVALISLLAWRWFGTQLPQVRNLMRSWKSWQLVGVVVAVFSVDFLLTALPDMPFLWDEIVFFTLLALPAAELWHRLRVASPMVDKFSTWVSEVPSRVWLVRSIVAHLLGRQLPGAANLGHSTPKTAPVYQTVDVGK